MTLKEWEARQVAAAVNEGKFPESIDTYIIRATTFLGGLAPRREILEQVSKMTGIDYDDLLRHGDTPMSRMFREGKLIRGTKRGDWAVSPRYHNPVNVRLSLQRGNVS